MRSPITIQDHSYNAFRCLGVEVPPPLQAGFERMKWLKFLWGGRGGAKGGPTDDFHAVSLMPGRTAFDAARAMQLRRFLSRESPPGIPLPTCDRAAACTCRYRHYDDRRGEPRRDSDHLWAASGQSQRAAERRRKPGRRKTDRR